jgi:hypothetical protein
MHITVRAPRIGNSPDAMPRDGSHRARFFFKPPLVLD